MTFVQDIKTPTCAVVVVVHNVFDLVFFAHIYITVGEQCVYLEFWYLKAKPNHLINECFFKCLDKFVNTQKYYI